MEDKKELINSNTSLIVDENKLMKEYVTISLEQNNENKSILSELEQEILILRYGLYDEKVHSFQEIGQRLGYSIERIRQIEMFAMNKIRKNIKIDFKRYNKKEYLKAVSYLINKNYKQLLDIMPYEDAAVYLITNGAIYGIILTPEEISDLLDMDVDKVNESYHNASKALSSSKSNVGRLNK